MPRCQTKGCENDCLGDDYPDHEEEGCLVDIEYCDECNIKEMQDDADKDHEENEKVNENDVHDDNEKLSDDSEKFSENEKLNDVHDDSEKLCEEKFKRSAYYLLQLKKRLQLMDEIVLPVLPCFHSKEKLKALVEHAPTVSRKPIYMLYKSDELNDVNIIGKTVIAAVEDGNSSSGVICPSFNPETNEIITMIVKDDIANNAKSTIGIVYDIKEKQFYKNRYTSMKTIIDTFNYCPLNDYDGMDTIINQSKAYIINSFNTPRKDRAATSTQNIIKEKRESKPVLPYSHTETKGSKIKTPAVNKGSKIVERVKSQKTKVSKSRTPSRTTSTKTKPNIKNINHSDDFVDDNYYLVIHFSFSFLIMIIIVFPLSLKYNIQLQSFER